MKGPIGFGVLFAFCFIILKMSFYFASIFVGNILPLSFINMFFLLLAISIGLYYYDLRRAEKGESMMQELKQGLKAGMVYTFITCGFLFIYYKKIDQSILVKMQNERIDDFKKGLDNPTTFVQIKASNEAFEVMTADEILDEVKSNIKDFISARSLFLISLMSMMLLSILYSLLITIIYRKVLFRNYLS